MIVIDAGYVTCQTVFGGYVNRRACATFLCSKPGILELQNSMLETIKGIQFQLVGGHLCLDFTNTLDNRGSGNEVNLIPTYGHLLQFALQAGALTSNEVRQLRSAVQAHQEKAQIATGNAMQLRETLFQVFSAIANQKEPSSAALQHLNSFVLEAGAHRIVSREGQTFRWQWKNIGSNPRAALWPIAWKAAELLTSDDLAFVRECASPTCSWLFLDKSRSHSRRWCDMRVCGNRLKVRKFYERARARGG
jgi:predicted RNA-binding Zn ribbon-like protein